MTIPATFFVPVSQCGAGSSKKPTWSFWKMSVLVVFFLVAGSASAPDLDDFGTFAKEYVANISVLSGMFAQATFLKSSERVFLFQKDFVEDGKKKKRLADMFLFDRLVCLLQASDDPWYKEIAKKLLAYQGKKDICVTFATNGSNVMAHIVVHKDEKMVSLANDFAKIEDETKLKFPFSFPRGFGILFNKDRITGVAPFYPKFNNDEENSFQKVVDGKYDVGSFFVKYSGSLAKVLIWKDENGKICWTVMSKNSADSTAMSGDSGINYPRELASVIAPYMTQERLQAIYASGVRSFCAEVMLACDNSHGYRAINGFIVTCAATGSEFLGSQRLTEWCESIGLPTDRPLHIEGTDKILAFVQELNRVRDVMTVDVLQAILTKFGLEYDLSKHRHIVQSLVFEGFIITLRNEKGEKLVLKYKFAFYTAVTMFLREYIKNIKKGDSFDVETKISGFLKRWVFDKSVEMQSLWSWILHEMVRVADTQSFEGPVESWIQASELVYARVFPSLAENDNDVAKVCERLGCPMLEQQKRSLIEVTIALVLGPIGYGKSTFASYLAALYNAFHVDGDGNEAWLPKDLVLALKGERNAETVAAILAAIQAGKNVVFSTGGGAIWSFPNCGQKAMNSQTISFLETKAKEMGIKLKFVVYVPDNMEAEYAKPEEVRSAIEGRKARGEKWGDEKFIQNLCTSSAKNIEFAKRFMKQAVEVHTYPRFIFDDVTNKSALRAIFQSGTDLMSSNPQTPLELSCLRQQQLVSIGEISSPTISAEVRIKYADPAKKGKLLFTFPNPDGSTFHITLSYDADKTPKPLAPPFFEVGSTQTAPLHHCVAKLSEGTLAPFVFIDLGCGGMHVTVHPGRFKPESMRAVALAMQAGQSSAMFVPQQGAPEELTFEVLSSQQVQIGAHHVVSHA
jgi:shikimate kinase